MPTEKEVHDKLLALIREKIGEYPNCVLCGKRNWITGPKWVWLSVTNNPNLFPQGAQGFPTAPLVCGTCGNTHLLNVIVLAGSKDAASFLAVDDDESGKDEGK